MSVRTMRCNCGREDPWGAAVSAPRGSNTITYGACATNTHGPRAVTKKPRQGGLTYRDAGVDIDAQDDALRRIKELMRSARTSGSSRA